jgi:hypothetical protein
MVNDLENENGNFKMGSYSSGRKWLTIFEDYGQTGYMYLCSSNKNGDVINVIDNLWIYNKINPPIEKCKEVLVIWSVDGNRTALIVDGECWGIIDVLNKRKLSAPRVNNSITSIEMEVWANGISELQGEPLKLTNL